MRKANECGAQIENGRVDGRARAAVAYEPLSLTDVSGLLLAVVGAYGVAAAALVAEHCCSAWRAEARNPRARECAAQTAVARPGSHWVLTDVLNGSSCALPQWLQQHAADAQHAELLAAVSSAAG